MILKNVPIDLRVEALMNYLPADSRRISVAGPHKRNAYEDIVGLRTEDESRLRVSVGRKGLYDLLPEALFHPVDRYDNIPANEYDERFKEEVRLQEEEEEKARKFFALFDGSLLGLSAVANRAGNGTDENSFVADLIGDNVKEETKGNRFVRKIWRFLPIARSLRGDRTMLSLVIRNILRDEAIVICKETETARFADVSPRYDCGLDTPGDEAGTYLGNVFDEARLSFRVRYWSPEETDGDFLRFAEELGVFEDFINDWFVGIGDRFAFDLVNETDSVLLDDPERKNYLDYNTNL